MCSVEGRFNSALVKSRVLSAANIPQSLFEESCLTSFAAMHVFLRTMLSFELVPGLNCCGSSG